MYVRPHNGIYVPYGRVGDAFELSGTGGDYLGEIPQDSDSQLYERGETLDYLGNPVGFWTKFGGPFKQAGKAVKEFFNCGSHAHQIDFNKAIRLNNRLKDKYKWKGYKKDIEKLLGFTTTPNDKEFARRVAFWQCRQGFNVVDGVIGKNTWSRMEAIIRMKGAPPAPRKLPSPVSRIKQVGESPLAASAAKRWDKKGKDRPKRWQGQVYGLVVHTTGGSLPARAREAGIYHAEYAMNYYSHSMGCHYVNGWRGIAGGDLLQMANENKRARGVGTGDQRRSINRGKFEKDLPAILVKIWERRWPGYKHSLSLLPKGERYVNPCYVHVECIPCVYPWPRKRGSYKAWETAPMREGLRFTKAQHDTIAHLAVDIARRNGWPKKEEWWRSPRLLGHEDLTPLTRHDKRGGWDPGYLRKKPYFDWDYVYMMIRRILNS